jgi:putative phosphoesterase
VDAGSFAAPLTIGVIADTHIYAGSRRNLSGEILDLFRRFSCGLILHLGDVNTLSVIEELRQAAPVLVVEGNNDEESVREIAPLRLTFLVGTTRVAMLHGHDGSAARSEAAKAFAGRADLVIYGHSHVPMIEQVDGTILFNPGSATDRRWHPHFGIGIIRISDDKIDPELILFNQPAELANVHPR